jgi:hypothetical protein
LGWQTIVRAGQTACSGTAIEQRSFLPIGWAVAAKSLQGDIANFYL